MRTRPFAALALAAVLAVGAGCGDDDADDATATGPDESPTTSLSGPAGGLPPDRAPELVGEVTDREGDRLLVEEQPDAPDAGRKAWVTLEGRVFAPDGRFPTPIEPSEVEVGQRVSVWTGMCAQSYPEQCGAEAMLVEEE